MHKHYFPRCSSKVSRCVLMKCQHVCMHAGTGLLSAPAAHLARRTIIHRRVSAAAVTLETATKQNVGAAASKSQTHVGLNSGHLMPLFGWGTSGVNDAACITATKKAVELGYRVCVPPCQHVCCSETGCMPSKLLTGLHANFCTPDKFTLRHSSKSTKQLLSSISLPPGLLIACQSSSMQS